MAAVADQVKAQLAVGSLDGAVNLLLGHDKAAVGHHQLEVRNGAFDRPVNLLFRGERGPKVNADVHRPGGQILDRLGHDLQALAHFGHPHQVAGKAVAGRGAAHLKVEIGVGQVRLVLAQIAGDAAGPGDRAGGAAGDRFFLREHADALGAIDEDTIAIQQPLHVVERARKIAHERADLLDRQRRGVVHQTAHAGVAVGKPRAAQRFENVVQHFALIECVQEERERPDVEPDGPVAQQVVADPRQLGQNGPQILAAGRQFQSQQLFHRAVPGDVVGQRRDVVHAIGHRDVLIVVQVFAELFEARVQKADVGHRVDDPLAVERQQQAQRGVRGRMLRTEVQGPYVIAGLGHVVNRFGVS